VTFLLASLSFANGTYANELVSASFYNHAIELEKIIELPDYELEGTVIIRCAARIPKTGYSSNYNVYTDQSQKKLYGPYEKAIRKALKHLRLHPAKVNGVREKVCFNFSVVFESHGDNKKINIYPSHLYDTNNYDQSYLGPQRVISHKLPITCQSGSYIKGPKVWMVADIDTDGNA